MSMRTTTSTGCSQEAAWSLRETKGVCPRAREGVGSGVDGVERVRDGAEEEVEMVEEFVARSELEENGKVVVTIGISALSRLSSSSALLLPFPLKFTVELELRADRDEDFSEDFPLTMSNSLEEPLDGVCTFLNFQRTAKSPDTRGTFVIWCMCKRT
jgi:hypothetical protein